MLRVDTLLRVRVLLACCFTGQQDCYLFKDQGYALEENLTSGITEVTNTPLGRIRLKTLNMNQSKYQYLE